MTLLLVAAGAAVGAPLRYLVDRLVTSRLVHHRQHAAPFPWGILLVNVLGSLLLGLVSAIDVRVISLLVGVGFCGAFTTYSTFAALTVQLVDQGRARVALGNVVLSLGGCLAAATLGHLLGAALFPA